MREHRAVGVDNRGGDGAKVFSEPVDTGPVIDTARCLFGVRYGGVWNENEAVGRKVVVAVAGAEPTDAVSLRDTLGGDTDWLEVVSVRYSEAQLLEFLDRLNSVLDQARPTASLVIGPDTRNNCIRLEINPEDPERLVPRLKAAVPDDVLAVRIARFVVGPG